MRIRNCEFVALVSVLGLSLSCTDTMTVCTTSAVTVTASSSTHPTFRWSPNCVAGEVLVEEARTPSSGGNHTVWLIAALSAGNGTDSPVLYGYVPPRMGQTQTPEPLVSGHAYIVSVLNVTGQMIGQTVFGP